MRRPTPFFRRPAALCLAALLATSASSQPVSEEAPEEPAPLPDSPIVDLFEEVELWDVNTGEWDAFLLSGPFLDCVRADGIASVDLDQATPRPELLVHRGLTITWHDLDAGTSGTLGPPPPAAITALVGVDVAGSPRQDLVMSNSVNLWSLDLDAGTPWTSFAPSPPFAPISLAAADVAGGAEEELIATDGDTIAALDLHSPPLAWTTLLAPPDAPDSIAGVDVGFVLPSLVIVRLLAANAGDTTHYYVPTSLSGNPPVWDFPNTRRYGISSAAPSDSLRNSFPTLPPAGEMVVPTPLATSAIRLKDVAVAAGLGDDYAPGGDGHCPGAVFTDLDGDHLPDLYLPRGDDPDEVSQTNLLFYNDGSGGFLPIAGADGADDSGNSSGAIAADFVGDDRRDLYVINFNGPNTLYERRDSGYVDVTPGTDPTGADDGQAGLGVGCGYQEIEPDCTLDATLAAAAGDFDRDGDLDLFVGNQLCCQGFTEGERDVLYLNNGDGTFEDVTVSAGITADGDIEDSSTQALLVADFNNDRWPDIFITHKGQGPQREELFLNDGDGGDGVWDGTFTEWFTSPGQNDPRLGNVTCAAMGLDAADYDHDGDLDVFLTDISNDGPGCVPGLDVGATDMDLYKNLLAETGTFSLVLVEPNPVASPDFAWGTSWSDFDNDGDLELHVSTAGNRMNWLHRNDGGGAGFADVAIHAGAALARDSRASVPADLDRDGRVDLLVAHRGSFPVSMLENRTPKGGRHWIEVRLVNDPVLLPSPFLSTRDAVGARIDVFDGTTWQRRDVYAGGHSCGSTRDYVAHFGVGSADLVDVVVSWPSGRTTRRPDEPVDQVLVIQEQ